MITAEQRALLLMDSWAGREVVYCTIVGETPQRYRIRLAQDAVLPGKRAHSKGDVVLVPKYPIRPLMSWHTEDLRKIDAMEATA
jgi:hypothetical protein